MTCIVGLVNNGHVHLAGDSAGVADHELRTRRDPKVFHLGPFVIGFTSSFRMGQILRYNFAPEFPSVEADPGHIEPFAYMVQTFIPALRETLEQGGYRKRENEVESGGTFLVGFHGRLFKVHSDFQVEEALDPFNACGCGEPYAMGALAAVLAGSPTDAKTGKPLTVEDILITALNIAQRYSAGVRGPFTHVTTMEEQHGNP